MRLLSVMPSWLLAPCSIVRSFDVIVGVFAQQLVEGDSYSFMTENILIVAELVSWLRVDSGMYNRRQYTIILYLY